MARDDRVAHLLKLPAEAVGILGIASADLQGDEAGFRILQQPIRGFAPLESPPHDPASRHVDESQCDRLRGILRDPVPIELLGIPNRRPDPMQAGFRRFRFAKDTPGVWRCLSRPKPARWLYSTAVEAGRNGCMLFNSIRSSLTVPSYRKGKRSRRLPHGGDF
jgi:hypothetical protein